MRCIVLKYMAMFCYVFALSPPGFAKDPAHTGYLLELTGAIGPAMADYLIQGMTQAETQGGHLVVIKMDTPGGLMEATRDIIQVILRLSIPVITYVAPNGARADSAGTYILYASHVAAMAPTSHLGAATPVAVGSPWSDAEKFKDSDKDQNDPPQQPATKPNGRLPDPRASPPERRASPMEQKQINDAVAYIRSLAELRNRNIEWAEKAVTEALTLPARQALKVGVIEFIAQDLDELMIQIDGLSIPMPNQPYLLQTADLQIELIEPTWRNRFLATLTNPNIAYILLLVGIYGLILEAYNPGMGFPGIIGAISFLLALYAFQLLPISYVGLGLTLLGIALMIVEATAPSFGIFGIGGAIAFIFGSIILMDTQLPAFKIALPVIAAVSLLTLLYFFLIMGLMTRLRSLKVVTGANSMIGETAVALEAFDQEGQVEIAGEIWHARCADPVAQGEKLKVQAVQGLTLLLSKVEHPQSAENPQSVEHPQSRETLT